MANLLPVPSRAHLCAVIFLLSTLVVAAAPVAVAGPADDPIQPWTPTTAFDGPRASHAAAIDGDHVYIMGGLYASQSSFNLYDDVQLGTLSANGLITHWQKLTPFEVPRSGLGGIAYNHILYVVAGYANSGAMKDVQFARLKQDGTIDHWQRNPDQLNVPRSNHALQVIITPSGAAYLAAIGGVNQFGNDTVHLDNVEVAPIGRDGTIGAWKICPFHFKGGRSAPATIVTGGRLYVLGGWGDLLEDVFRDVQYAEVRNDGCTQPWHTSPTPLLFPQYGSSAVVDAERNRVFLVGGNAGQGNYSNSVAFGAIDQSGDIGHWLLSKNQMAGARWGHASIQYKGIIYVFGGAARESGQAYLSDVQYTRITP